MPLPSLLQAPEVRQLIQLLRDKGLTVDEDDPEQMAGLLQTRLAKSLGISADISDMVPDKVIPNLDIAGIAQYIQEGKAKRVIVMVGAGLSTAAGIPDFRTPGTGLYDNLQKYNLPDPQAIFSIDHFRKHPGAFYELARDLWPGNYAPTTAHFFLRLLEEKGLLLRCYTQNIDSLEELAGVSRELVVAAHGNFSSAHGIDTGVAVPVQELQNAVQRGEEGWAALRSKWGELVKPDIVFFGEALPERFRRLLRQDFTQCDLLIVMGTSLVVAPFCECIGFVGDSCPRLLVNRELVGLESRGAYRGFRIGEERNYRDVFYEGDCDVGLEALCKDLGWAEDLAQLKAIGPVAPHRQKSSRAVGSSGGKLLGAWFNGHWGAMHLALAVAAVISPIAGGIALRCWHALSK